MSRNFKSYLRQKLNIFELVMKNPASVYVKANLAATISDLASLVHRPAFTIIHGWQKTGKAWEHSSHE